MTLRIGNETVETTPRFLTSEDIKERPQDRRCVVCLERAYAIWIEKEEPPGCPFGHIRKEDCHEFAVPGARARGDLDELRKRGLVK